MVELAECLDKDSRLKEGDTMERYESFQTVNNSKWAQGPVLLGPAKTQAATDHSKQKDTWTFRPVA